MRYFFEVLFVLFLFLCSCSNPSPETKFDKGGVSFTCPQGWKIVDETNLDGAGYYMSIEKDGLNSSGLLSVSWVNDSIDLVYYMDIFKDELRNNFIYKNGNLKIQDLFETKFNGIDAIATNFTSTVLGLEHEGVIYCMYGSGKTIGLIKQQALEDSNVNKKGFGILEGSFLVKELF